VVTKIRVKEKLEIESRGICCRLKDDEDDDIFGR
jgi:hypothetical protein